MTDETETRQKVDMTLNNAFDMSEDEEREENERFVLANRRAIERIEHHNRLVELAFDAYHDPHFPMAKTPFDEKPHSTERWIRWFVTNFETLDLVRYCDRSYIFDME
uniref:Uncharacterized protein n=1 Tax=viral metagenome TaxID=1070528 RepID=A0A6C0JQH8_9ZZZZ